MSRRTVKGEGDGEEYIYIYQRARTIVPNRRGKKDNNAERSETRRLVANAKSQGIRRPTGNGYVRSV